MGKAQNSEEEILRIAAREASVEHYSEFAPIAKGKLFAVLALLPLCLLAAPLRLWQMVRGKV